MHGALRQSGSLAGEPLAPSRPRARQAPRPPTAPEPSPAVARAHAGPALGASPLAAAASEAMNSWTSTIVMTMVKATAPREMAPNQSFSRSPIAPWWSWT